MDLGIDLQGRKKRRQSPIPISKRQDDQIDESNAKLSPPNIFRTFAREKDPIKEHLLEEQFRQAMEEAASVALDRPKSPKQKSITPEMDTRFKLRLPADPVFPRPPYTAPGTIKLKQTKLENKLKLERELHFCKWDKMHIPKPHDAEVMETAVELPSPDVSSSKLKVVPRKPSQAPSQGMPEPPIRTELELHAPKSGIIVNKSKRPPELQDYDSYDLVYRQKPRSTSPRETAAAKKKKQTTSGHKDGEDDTGGKIKGSKESVGKSSGDKKLSLMEAIVEEAQRLERGNGEEEGEENETLPTDTYLTKLFRTKVSLMSQATSLNSRDLDEFPHYDEQDLEEEPCMTKIVQKFRRDSEAQRYRPAPRQIKRGTLESHSFTKLKQHTLREFYYGLVMGTINENDGRFGESSRGCQGICMPVAAYCYSMLLHPNTWSEFIVDNILDVGNALFGDSLGHLHMHEEKKLLEYNELHKYCTVNDKKFQFQVFEPEIVGMVRSGDRSVYNLSKGLQLFYQRHRAGILKTMGTCILIWKERFYYFFDAKGRGKNLVPNSNTGKAILAHFYDIPNIATVLLEYANLGNWPYTISKICVYKVLDKDTPGGDDSQTNLGEERNYNILNQNKAVIQGSFDLADLCFDFSRNKQAIAMAAVCLVYSRITPPSAWHGKTIDKIMIIGNQLYLELVKSENVVEMELEKLPALFTIGPYIVEISIFTYVQADVMFSKSQCMLQKKLEKFFETSTMAIVDIGKFILAIWNQRDMFYCFDPYSRNNEGFKCRNGTACISMNSNLESLIETVVKNFDNNDIFYIHALKVLKIHRDPAQAMNFPKTMTMDDFKPESFKEYKMKKSKKKAVNKHVTADFTDTAVRKLLPWDFLGESVVEVGSGVESLAPDQLPSMVHKWTSRAMLRETLPPTQNPIDLDSPSLSDTQIVPDRPAPVQDEETIKLDAWDLTQEEIEMQGTGEDNEGGEDGEGGGSDLESYMAMHQYAQVHTDSLDSYHRKLSAQVNTDITVGFLPVPREVLPPTNMRWRQKIKKDQELLRKHAAILGKGPLPEVTKSQELQNPSNFSDLPDNSQIIKGTTNISTFGQEVDFMAPFICMMASAVAQKYALISWSPDIIDYTLKSGSKLYQLSKVRYDQVPVLEVPMVSLGRNNYCILVEYLYDAIFKQRVLELALEKVLFKEHECGLVVTPSYACTVFLKNHLYYMYDPFGCNEVGLGEGPSGEGVACFFRFKTIHDLASRIIYNKTKRDLVEEYEFTRFVVSSCKSKPIMNQNEPKPIKKRNKRGKSKRPVENEDGPTDLEDEEDEGGEEPKPENKIGYQLNDGIMTLQGSKALEGRSVIDIYLLKEDHFVCICAGLMLLNYPILKWDTKRVDYVIEQGKHIFAHADNLAISEKRIIRNILMYKHFFDIIVQTFKIPDPMKNRFLNIGLDSVMAKRDYIILQFSNASYVVYKHKDFFHLFDPYPCLKNGAQTESADGHAGWTMFNNFSELKKRINDQIVPDAGSYLFYTFEVTSVRKASKKLVLNQRMLEYDLDMPMKREIAGKPFHEKDIWLKKDPVPWSRRKVNSASDVPRGRKENMWHNWDVEYPKDLFSLLGTINENSGQFDENVRGKQTLANLVVCIGMTEIYELSEWSTSIMDSIILNGNDYMLTCLEAIEEEDHELEMKDLKTECAIYPYSFNVVLTPVVDGTMFLMRQQQYNLYKALKFFFGVYENRSGIMCVSKGDDVPKAFVAFGKVKDNEYFMYDCHTIGPPMFLHNQGFPYILRCKTLKRLLYIMVSNLRGGDFYIFEVDVDNLTGID